VIFTTESNGNFQIKGAEARPRGKAELNLRLPRTGLATRPAHIQKKSHGITPASSPHCWVGPLIQTYNLKLNGQKGKNRQFKVECLITKMMQPMSLPLQVGPT